MTDLLVLVNSLSRGYLIHQTLVIVMLHTVGLLFVSACDRSLAFRRWRAILAFPAGLALFAVTAFLMLCLGIPYNAVTISVALGAIALVSGAGLIRRSRQVDITIIRHEVIAGVIGIIAVTVIALMLTFNPFHMALDNDSLYYFSAYPNAIASEGRYIKYFDVFLTDAAPIGSIIQTLPYIYGFSETFAIQYMTDLCFLLIFASALYIELYDALGDRGSLIASLAATAFLLTSSAYLTTAKWVMAGVYFMSFFFITAYTAYYSGKKSAGSKPWLLLAVLAVMTSMLRQEGVVLTLLLVLTLSVLKEYKGKELTLIFLVPMMAAALLYYIRVFLILGVRPLYSFLTPMKACVITLMTASGIVYCLFIRDRVQKREAVLVALPILMVLADIGFFIMKPSEFLGDMKMFYLNIRIGAGWGYFGYIAFAVFVILVIKAVIRREKVFLISDSLYISYVLAVLVVSLGRGDALRKGVGDSGNRVMLTAVPLIVFGMTLRFFLPKGERDEDK
ncbi:MAG: hypothetical protein K6E90_05755 [Lachnospiraceae bacterium]|nr:hypothetical protein [Lachnospiraceae bacterium]